MYHAVKLNLRLYKFERALELAVKYNKYIEVVVGYRELYLKELNKQETDSQFKTYSAKVKVDWEDIKSLEMNENPSSGGGGRGGGGNDRRERNRDRK